MRPNGHGASWELLLGLEEQIAGWVAGGEDQRPLSIVKIEELLARQGWWCRIGRCTGSRSSGAGSGRKKTTVRVADGEPGVECQVDFAQMGDADRSETGSRRKVHALIFTAVVQSTHVRVVDLLPDPGRGDRRV